MWKITPFNHEYLAFYSFKSENLLSVSKDNICRLFCKQKIENLFTQKDFIAANIGKGFSLDRYTND